MASPARIEIQGADALRRLSSQLSTSKAKTAVRMAINDSLRWGRTRIKHEVEGAFNIKSQRITDTDRRKGLKVVLARNENLDGRITAGHRPINLASTNGVKTHRVEVAREITGYATNRRTQKTAARRGRKVFQALGISVEIVKGNRKEIQSAFTLPQFRGAVFARGKYAAMGFLFRHGKGSRKRTAGNDLPIESLASISVATAALSTRAFKKWEGPIQQKYNSEVRRQITRLTSQP